jgi:iron complex outermembrane recepter protein
MKISVISSASLIALSAATMYSAPAFAQDAAAEETVATDDIVVTATRSESLLSKTPIAMTALTGDSLRDAGVVSPTALTDQVPNLSIDRANGLQITIRGVTSTDGTEKGDPSAAFLLDGIYIARPQAQDVSFFDIDRVEVLRGPQGTLYGRNTTAGVVNVLANKPKPGKFEAAVNASYGNYNALTGDAMINAPVGDNAAIRASVSFDQRDSYLDTVAGDAFTLNKFRKNVAGRLQALFNVNDNITVLLRGDYAKLKGTRYTAVRASQFYGSALDANGSPVFIDNGSAARSLSVPLAQQPGINNESWGFSGELNWDMGGVVMTYLGSYRGYKANEEQIFDLGAPISFAAVFDGKYRQQSHELRFALDNDGPLKLQAGGYYFRERSGIGLYLFNLVGPVFGFPQDPTISKSYAGFAQAGYSFNDAIRLTAGGRYSHDDKFRYGHTVFQQTLTFNPLTDARLQNSAQIKSSKFTWRLGLDADVGERGLAYASVATGYKGGGFNDGCEAGTTTFGEVCNQARPLAQLYYQPETLTAYEIGYKGRFADDKVRINAGLFYYDYKNLQLSTVANFGGGPAQTTTNAAKASVKGLELEAILLPSPNDRFDLAFNYLDAKYKTYCPLGTVTPTTATCLAPDYSGRRLDRSPKIVASAGYAHTFELGNGSNVVAGVRTRLSDKYFVTAYGIPRQYGTPSLSKTDLTLTYNGGDDSYYIQGFAKNLENSITINNIDSFGNVTPGDPRTYGVRAGFKF